MKNTYLIYCGDYFSISGGYFYNRKVVENLKFRNINIEPIQLSYKQSTYTNETFKNTDEKIGLIPENSILLIDSLVFGSNHHLWKKYSHSHLLIPIVHLPLYLNSGFKTDSLMKKKELEAFNCAKHIIVTSEFTKSLLVKEGIANSKITIILPGVEPSTKRQHYPIFPEQLLCVSNFTTNKNQLMLLKVLNLLKHFSWTMHFVGALNAEEKYFADFKKYISLSKSDTRVIIHGELTGAELKHLFQHSDLFLFPSKFETYGMVVAEALSAGLPVLAYQSKGVQQSFKNYPVVYFNTERELQQLLVKLFDENSFYSELTNKMMESNIQFPLWSEVASSFAELLQHIWNKGV